MNNNNNNCNNCNSCNNCFFIVVWRVACESLVAVFAILVHRGSLCHHEPTRKFTGRQVPCSCSPHNSINSHTLTFICSPLWYLSGYQYYTLWSVAELTAILFVLLQVAFYYYYYYQPPAQN